MAHLSVIFITFYRRLAERIEENQKNDGHLMLTWNEKNGKKIVKKIIIYMDMIRTLNIKTNLFWLDSLNVNDDKWAETLSTRCN